MNSRSRIVACFVLCAVCSVLCAACFVLRALCCVLCAASTVIITTPHLTSPRLTPPQDAQKKKLAAEVEYEAIKVSSRQQATPTPSLICRVVERFVEWFVEW